MKFVQESILAKNILQKMKKISHFYDIKKGDCYLFTPKVSSENTKDKRRTIIIINDKISEIFAFSEKEIMEKILWKNENLSELTNYYFPAWSFYKLNKNETKKCYKEIILNSLEDKK